ncbi:sensor histidine kinase [Winogradskyella sp. PG-2]|uniref:sensor histidine kinase n=1 Tax=Winogradskyella sp. PG-2 TaxID=754409 RepID=UPI00045885A6|nr:histidine kinase [Winogradskyella sp. PG-2]BAO77692.1 putative two-component system sensor protein, no kinase domain [Winogradskyella sp. PG-2]
MKYDIKKLSFWFLVYYLVTDVIGEIIEADSISKAIDYHLQTHIVILTISVGFIFFLYALSSYSIFYKWHHKKPFWNNLVLILVSTIFIIGLRYLIEEIIFRTFLGFGNYKKGVSLFYYLLDNFYYVFQYCALGIIFYFWQYSKYKDERNNQLLLENQQMELDLLRSQTNPHFLFNTLNNIYALVNTNSEKALGAIEKLSLLLRYSLYKTKTVVPLEDEISQIRNFIDLESIRHKEPPHIEFNIEGITKNIKVPQFLLLPFVENAFKHGSLHSISQPIIIDITVDGTCLNYKVINEIEKKKKDKVGGLGLDNLKKRLELLFLKQYSFSCKTENSTFTAQLKIPIQ